MVRRLSLVAYDPRWAARFEEEKARILEVAGSRLLAVEHVGSTAIPGILAKPVLDILGGVRTLADGDALVTRLAAIGYEYVPEYEAIIPDRRYFRKGPAGARTHHLHVVEHEGKEWRKMMGFRDYLRAHPAVAREYGELKRRLARTFRDDRDAYQEAKASFIRDVLARAEVPQG